MSAPVHPRIVLRSAGAPPAELAPAEQRPSLGGRAGLVVMLDDGSRREITYDAGADVEAALAWVCESAQLGRERVVGWGHWSDGELRRWAARELAKRRRAAADEAELARLLSS